MSSQNEILYDSDLLKQKIFKHSMPEPNTGCWLWIGDTVKGGYGRSNANGKKWLSHRLSYEVFIGNIPNGLTIDHKCKVTSCCNPHHLEAVTQRENNYRSIGGICIINKSKTHCVKGHEFNKENTFFYKNNGRRGCRICMKETAIRYYSINKEKVKERSRLYHQKKQKPCTQED